MSGGLNLYLINGKWTDDYTEATTDKEEPEVHVNYDSGTYTDPLTVIITATDNGDPAPVIYYTTDGSTPTESSPQRASSVQVVFDTNGAYQLKYFAKDRSGNRSKIVTKNFTINMETPLPDVTADVEPGEYHETVIVTLTPQHGATVYFSEDGSTPDTNSKAFTSAKPFNIRGNGNHAIRCVCVSDSGRVYRNFNYTIDDLTYPQTGIAPSRGGIYRGSVAITLSPDEEIAWTKYATDGIDPDDENGILYTGSFTLTVTGKLKWRSKDTQGNVESVNEAIFTITNELPEAVFDNSGDKNGYVRAKPDGSDRSIGSFSKLAIGVDSRGNINRAILHFDTSTLPDNATITRAFLQVKYFSGMHDPWAENKKLVADVNTGYFGTSNALQTDDWDSKPTAEAAPIHHQKK